MLTVNALAAANRVIIPVQAEYLPAKGLEQLLQTVNKVKRQINPKPVSYTHLDVYKRQLYLRAEPRLLSQRARACGCAAGDRRRAHPL